MLIRNPILDEKLPLKREPKNDKNEYAVAVVKNSHIVGHVPGTLSQTLFYFLARPCNKGIAEITGNRINRGAGYGL